MINVRPWSRQWGEGLYGLALGVDIGPFKIYKPGHQWTITFRYKSKGIPRWYTYQAKVYVLERLLNWRPLWRLPKARRALLTIYHKTISL